jgi:transaldolase
MTNPLARLSQEQGQSPWLDNLTRSHLEQGKIAAFIERGVRGLTSNPTIFQKAIQGSADYDTQFGDLVRGGGDVVDHYWDLVITDIAAACDEFAWTHSQSGGIDGYVSLEVDPRLAHDELGTCEAARNLSNRLQRPNLMIKIPGTRAGLGAVRQMIAEGYSINVTLIFSVPRYLEVMEAYISGLEQRLAADPSADLSTIASVASFFVSRTDTEVDARLEALGTPQALNLRGSAALAQAHLAYQAFTATFCDERWERLVSHGARVQRPLWASTGTKNPAYSDVVYVEQLIGPHTVNTLPEATLEAFDHHGQVQRTVDSDPATAHQIWDDLRNVGIDMDDVAEKLEVEGIASFQQSFDDLIAALHTKAIELNS